jgi:hypothetical protein
MPGLCFMTFPFRGPGDVVSLKDGKAGHRVRQLRSSTSVSGTGQPNRPSGCNLERASGYGRCLSPGRRRSGPSVAAEDLVIAFVSKEVVGAAVAVDYVVPRPSVHLVPSMPGEDPVVATGTPKNVSPTVAEDHVVAVIPQDQAAAAIQPGTPTTAAPIAPARQQPFCDPKSHILTE